METCVKLNAKNKRNNSRHKFKKRAVPKPSRKETDIYISNKSNIKSYIERIEKLWTNGNAEVTVHALGACIPRAINLALQLQEKHYNAYDLDVITDSVGVVDDLLPTTDEDDFEIQRRWCSSINIRIFRVSKPSTEE